MRGYLKVEILEQVDEDWWNKLLCKSPHANIFQTANGEIG